MGLNAKNAPGGNNFEPMEPGTYPARLVQVVDCGLQAQRPYQGQDKPPANEISLTYEFVDEFQKDDDGEDKLDKPRWLTETMGFYNLENDRANSTKRYKALDPNLEHDGDFTALLDTPVHVTVVHNPGKGKNAHRIYENVAGVSLMRSKDAELCPALVNEARAFDLDAPDLGVFQGLPNWMQEKIKGNLEFKGSLLEVGLATLPSDEPEKDAEAEEEAPY